MGEQCSVRPAVIVRDTARPWRMADVLAWVAMTGWVAYAALGTNVFGSKPWPSGVVDYLYIYEFSRQIVADRTFPTYHAYPPPAVILHFLTAQFPFSISAALFLALTIVAALACCWLPVRILHAHRRPGAFLLMALSVATASYYWYWDLRSQNCNLIFLAAALLGVFYVAEDRPRAAGFWLALSVSLKLFSVLLLPYLAWRGRWRALAWALAFSAVLWIVLPAAVFGGDGFIEIYRNWFERVRQLSSSQPNFEHAILISLHNSAHWLTEGSEPANSMIVNAFRVVWLALFGVALLRRWRPGPPRDRYGLLSDVGLLLLAPVAVSPYLEPYHPVAAVIPALVLLDTAWDAEQRRGVRLLGLLLFVAGLALSKAPCAWEVRGLVVNVHLFFLTASATLIAWLRQPRSHRATTIRMPPAEAAPVREAAVSCPCA